jgi:hypothetical protein
VCSTALLTLLQINFDLTQSDRAALSLCAPAPEQSAQSIKQFENAQKVCAGLFEHQRKSHLANLHEIFYFSPPTREKLLLRRRFMQKYSKIN